MRQFNGFLFDVNSEEFTKKRNKLLRWAYLQLHLVKKETWLPPKGSGFVQQPMPVV